LGGSQKILQKIQKKVRFGGILRVILYIRNSNLTFSDSTFITYSATNEFDGTYVADYESSGINIVTSFGGTKVGSWNLLDWWDVFPKFDKFMFDEAGLKFYYDDEDNNNNRSYLFFKPLL
jgi:hypothetical protein